MAQNPVFYGSFYRKRTQDFYRLCRQGLKICPGGGNIARLSALSAGLDEKIPAFTVDMQCASGLESIIAGWTRIKAGINETVIAGGCESFSTACRLFTRIPSPDHSPFSSGQRVCPVLRMSVSEGRRAGLTVICAPNKFN